LDDDITCDTPRGKGKGERAEESTGYDIEFDDKQEQVTRVSRLSSTTIILMLLSVSASLLAITASDVLSALMNNTAIVKERGNLKTRILAGAAGHDPDGIVTARRVPLYFS
jgi:hypothetical protein